MARSRAARVARLAVVVFVSSRKGSPARRDPQATPSRPEPTVTQRGARRPHRKATQAPARTEGTSHHPASETASERSTRLCRRCRLRLSGSKLRPAVATTVRRCAHARTDPVHWGRSSGSDSRPILRSRSSRHRRCTRTDSCTRRRAAVVVRSTVAGAAAMAELSRRAAARARIGRRLALVRQADILRLAASGSTRVRGIVGAADQPIITGAFRPAVARAPLAGASREVALVRPHAVTRSTGETRVIGAARQTILAVALHAAVAAAATARARRKERTQRIAADQGRRAGSWSPRRTVRIVRSAEERRITTGVLRSGGAIAANARSRGIGADLLRSGRCASHLQP